MFRGLRRGFEDVRRVVGVSGCDEYVRGSVMIVSPQARTFFKKLCEEEGVGVLQLLKWVRTRWASLYDLICRLLDVRPVSDVSSTSPQILMQIIA